MFLPPVPLNEHIPVTVITTSHFLIVVPFQFAALSIS